MDARLPKRSWVFFLRSGPKAAVIAALGMHFLTNVVPKLPTIVHESGKNTYLYNLDDFAVDGVFGDEFFGEIEVSGRRHQEQTSAFLTYQHTQQTKF